MRLLHLIQGKFERDKQGTNVKSSTLCLYTSISYLQADTPIHPARQRQRRSIKVSCRSTTILQTAFKTHNDLIDDFTRTKHFLSATHLIASVLVESIIDKYGYNTCTTHWWWWTFFAGECTRASEIWKEYSKEVYWW